MEDSPVMQNDLVRELHHQSTWRLLLLGFLTYGVYYAYYISRQTRAINPYLPVENRIPPSFVVAIFVLSYVTLGLFIGYLTVDEQHPIALASTALDRVWVLCILAWGFYARNRMNTINAATPGETSWFSGFWTFLFSPLYFNYKVNVLNSGGRAQRVAA